VKLNFQATDHASRLTRALPANFFFVQLLAQEPDICDKRHPNCARHDKINLAWERISHETKESGSR
jgi:hypothetical protein